MCLSLRRDGGCLPTIKVVLKRRGNAMFGPKVHRQQVGWPKKITEQDGSQKFKIQWNRVVLVNFRAASKRGWVDDIGQPLSVRGVLGVTEALQCRNIWHHIRCEM